MTAFVVGVEDMALCVGDVAAAKERRGRADERREEVGLSVPKAEVDLGSVVLRARAADMATERRPSKDTSMVLS